MSRRRLKNRRASVTFDIESQGLKFTCTASRFPDGSLAEVFLQNHKAGSMAGINAQDSAVVCSLALQHGVPLETIRHALMRGSRGVASGPLGVVLDMISAGDGA
jgi:ribonucleoside-diphosphate reductase alpha chain